MVDSEFSAVTWGGRELPYAIRRNACRKTAEFKVLPGGTVELRAPMHLDIDALDAFAAQEAPWIAQRLDGVGYSLTAPAPRAFVTGESVFYLGAHHRLKVLVGETGIVKLRNGWLEVPVSEGRPEATRATLIAWFRNRAEAKLPELVEAWRETVGVPMPRVAITNYRKRLANCDRDGTIRLNWRLVQARLRVIDYVVVHQLVHLLHRGHGRRYWQALKRVMPECYIRRENLRREGAGLFW